MLLDAVLDTPGTRWLATEREKVDYFVKDRLVPSDLLQRLGFGRPSGQGPRYFPDKLPIGVVEDEATPVFLYGVTRERPLEFRAFLHRHAELLRALRTWEIRVLVTPEQEAVLPAFEWAAQEELAEPLAPATATDLRWYFEQRQVIDGCAGTGTGTTTGAAVGSSRRNVTLTWASVSPELASRTKVSKKPWAPSPKYHVRSGAATAVAPWPA